MSRVYLDHNATSPLRPEALEAMLHAFGSVGNPSSVHGEGRAARKIIEDARETVARSFEVRPASVVFTSGGTEAANWLLQQREDGRLILSATEHACVLHGHRYGADRVTVVPVSGGGTLNLHALEKALAPGAAVAVQAANNETGVIQPLSGIAAAAKASQAVLICDAVQAVGRVPLSDLKAADALFLSAHKFGGPKGVGAVILRNEIAPVPFLRGGGQERRQRSGTENVAGIAGMAAAFEAASAGQPAFTAYAKDLRDLFEGRLREIAPEAVIFGDRASRLPNTACFAIPGKSAAAMLMSLDLEGFAVSSGSACSSGKVETSHVLAAMGCGAELSSGAIRVSSGWTTAEADIERLLAAIGKVCGRMGVRQAA
jgi:cysteine desulfurase